MNKQKPKVFANQITKPIDNCQKIYYSKIEELSKEKPKEKKEDNKLDKFIKMDVEQKISSLMNLPKYLYDIDLIITTESEILETNIVGKNNSSLITMDNKLIPITEIVNIDVKK